MTPRGNIVTALDSVGPGLVRFGGSGKYKVSLMSRCWFPRVMGTYIEGPNHGTSRAWIARAQQAWEPRLWGCVHPTPVIRFALVQMYKNRTQSHWPREILLNYPQKEPLLATTRNNRRLGIR